MISYKSENDDWSAFEQEERSLEERIHSFNSKLDREKIHGKIKEILLKEYLHDIGSQMGYKVIS